MKKRNFLLLLTLPVMLMSCQAGPMGPQGEKGETGQNGSDGRGIVSVVLTSFSDTQDTYTITYTDGTTSVFYVNHGEKGIQGEPGKDGHTPVVTIGENGNWFIDGVDSGFQAQGVEGQKGDKGDDGRGIKSIVLSGYSNGVSTYTILYTDGTTSSFQVKDGQTGEMGPQGIQGIPGEDGHTPVITIGDNGNWFVDGLDSGIQARGDKGDQGEKGDKGDQGVSIVKIEKTSTNGNIDTYTITYSDSTTSTFTVSNGENGHSPVVTIGENGHFFIDGADSGVKAQGDKGDTGVGVSSISLSSTNGKVDTYTITFTDGSTTSFNVTNGTDGKSAYGIYKENHPEYEGTESEWIEDLVNGNLREKYTVKFNTNGGSKIENQKASYGHLVTRPADDPTKTGYLFDGWYLNGEPFPFNSYQVYDNISLYAKWRSNDLTLTLDAGGGEVEYNTKTVTYGVKYVLPTPTRDNYAFDGWYYDGNLCPLSGVWNFASQDITLTARWAGTQVTASFQQDENLDFDFDQTQTIVYGSEYSLPVPTISTGDRFVGWALSDGTILTDENGKSLKPADFKSDVVLHAVYYIDITTPNQLINLALKEAGSQELSRTYVIQKDLDFTGMQTQPIANFEGILDGNGHKIVGLGSPLFSSVGRTETSKAVIKNITFENLSATCIVENVVAAASVTASDITISSFVIDESDYCNYYGFFKTIGSYDSYKPSSVYLDKYYVDDVNATVDCGMVYDIEWADNTYITNSYTKCGAKESAFVSRDRFCTKYAGDKLPRGKTNVKISYCSNWGDSPCLTRLSSMLLKHRFYNGTSVEKFDDATLSNVTLDSIANYGTISKAIFDCSIPKINIGDCYGKYMDVPYYGFLSEGKYRTPSSTVSNPVYYYKRQSYYAEQCPSICKSILNFGAVNSFVNETESKDYFVRSPANYTFVFNAGRTATTSIKSEEILGSFYNFIPLTNCSTDGALEVTSYSQISSDFFQNTFGLDPEKWNLDYINLQDEYGLPTIRY